MSENRPGGTGSSDGGGPDAGPDGVPRWVKICGLIGVVVVVLVGVMLASGHGPGRHMQHSLPALTSPVISGDRR